MERTRATWTDERLDDLSQRISEGFGRHDQELRGLRTDMNARFDAVHRTTIQVGGATIVTVLATIASVIATRG